MSNQFQQVHWDATLEDDCRQLVRLAVREDLDRGNDWTTLALVPHDAQGRADVVVRQTGIVAGLPAARLALKEMESRVELTDKVEEGAAVAAGACVAQMSGPSQQILTCERIVLNFIARLSGIATNTRRYVDAVADTAARIYDTRKTTPGWRRLEKYAVRCGGGWNHRTGLFDALLIKDNHLAELRHHAAQHTSPADAVTIARQFAERVLGAGRVLGAESTRQTIIEVEIDTLDQFDRVLANGPDIVLLDNMTVEQLSEAVTHRNTAAAPVQLEASGGITIENVSQVARTGVDRISIGALTHSASWLDIGLDWHTK